MVLRHMVMLPVKIGLGHQGGVIFAVQSARVPIAMKRNDKILD